MVDLNTSVKRLPTPNVHKFGGTSLKDSAGLEQVVKTIQEQVKRGDFLVVSANGPVTDYLLAISQGKKRAMVALTGYLTALIESSLRSPAALLTQVKQDLNQLSVWAQQPTFNHHDVLALGELWSAQMLAAKLAEQGVTNEWLDARDFLTVDEQNQLANRAIASNQLRQTHNLCHQHESSPWCHIITGYIARDLCGDGITLGRNGSDYTATLLADLLQSPTVFLWTDVDGVYTADPHLVEPATRVAELTMCEAQALSELGSNVLHEKTIAPILSQTTNLSINTCKQPSSGTQVVRQDEVSIPQKNGQGQVKTLTHKSNLVYLSVQPINELKARQFQAQLTAVQIPNYANHFDKTNHSLGFYVNSNDQFKATQLIKTAGLQIKHQLNQISLISAVGQEIRQNTRVINKFIRRAAAFKLHNIHYPANDHTLCVLLSDAQARALLQDLHATFFTLEPSIPIVVLGYGNIGKQFLSILKQHKSAIEQRVKQSLSVVAVANSRFHQYSTGCLLDEAIDLSEANQQGELLDRLQVLADKPAVVIDLTASDWVAAQYVDFANNGWHIIAANKVAAADHEWATEIELVLAQKHRRWLKNTTVGAALPIQDALQKLTETGDQVRAVSGVFSGSLSWLLGQYDGDKPFMDWVRLAQEKAYTEPDPRDDLSGQDVYRKALILARELGFKPSKIHFEPVIPAAYLEGSKDTFWGHHEAINQHLHELWQQASKHNQQLRYLATVSAAALRVELVAVDADHAAAQLKPGDNIFIIESDWYADNPLVIQGPGAGREVTAAGVLNDLIEVLQSV